MHAEMIAIGDEITSGQTLDTNTQWLSQRIEELGIRVLYQTAVGDELAVMAEVLREAVHRADVVVATGGLGPTADDLTRQALAQAAGRELVFDAEILETIKAMFTRRGRRMPDSNREQAMFPEGSRAIPNPHGTAPGIAMEIPREAAGPCRFFALPGVPAEMKEMWRVSVSPEIRGIDSARRVIRHRKIKCFGEGESQIEEMLPDLIRRGRQPRVGITASKATIILRITAEGAGDEECDAAIEPTAATIRRCLGNLVFGEGEDELQDAVVRLLRERNRTLATVEWGTGGLAANWLGGVEEAEGRHLGSLVVRDDAALMSALDVPAELIERHTARSAEVTAAMARNCRGRFNADLGLAIGPFPKFDPEASRPERFYVALAGADETRSQSYAFAGHPALLRVLSAKRALNLARLNLLEG
jgi:nicotinamide-nucleotide amidase